MTGKEKDDILNEHEMNPEEMKTLSGGVVIDWPAKCHATVESGGNCWGTDACYRFSETYYRDKAKHGCSSTVASNNWCASSDSCELDEIRYDTCAEDFATEMPDAPSHG